MVFRKGCEVGGGIGSVLGGLRKKHGRYGRYGLAAWVG
jgi:hypothetical protein